MTQAAVLAQMGSQNQTFRNRLINPAMVIDQRNAGASVSATGQYTLDRWGNEVSVNSKFTVQQTPSATETGYATRVGAGFTNYLACTSSAATSVGATDYYLLTQPIEGYNMADLAWGTSSAKSVTVSFWAYSSLTGTFGATINNNAQNRTYPFTYTISSANTWTYVTSTIPGCTDGTWVTNNGIGARLRFNLGTGSTYSAAAGAWSSTSLIFAPTGSTQVVATSGATFYITGVQLEAGTSATPFEYRSYGTELALCQRYYVKVASSTGSGSEINSGWYYSNTHMSFYVVSPVPMRTVPTLSAPSGTDYYVIFRNGTSDTFNSINGEIPNFINSMLSCYNNTEISGTAGQTGIVRTNNASAYVALTAEL
jgi:hypothetical protein